MSESEPPLEEDLGRAWDLLEEGDHDAARGAGEALRRADPDAPEVCVLLAACARAVDDDDEALACLDRAAALDPEWAEPDLRAAEILAAIGDLEAAVQRAGLAVDKAEEEEELFDAVALKAGLEIDQERTVAARRTLAALPSAAAATPPPDLVREIGHLHLALGEAAAARSWFDRAIAFDPQDPDAWHGVGLAAELAGDEEEKRRAWLETLDLDGGRDGEEGAQMSEAQMAEVAESALAELPPRARGLLSNVPILIADRPARRDVATGLDPRLLGLFAGSAYPDVSALGGSPHLTQILLFRRNLERVAEDEQELREEIRTTLLHETGHFFGMSEEDLDEVGLG